MHAIQHEEWCAAIAAGELGEVPEELRGEIEGCADCARRIEELRALRRDLSRLGDDDREIVAAAEKTPAPADEERIERRLRELVGERPPVARGSPRRWLALAAAAGIAIVAGGLAWRWTRPSSNTPQQTLGTMRFEEMRPRAGDTQLSPMTWRVEHDPDTYFTVTVRATDGSGVEDLISPRLHESRWELSPADLARLPPRSFEWSVQVFMDPERFVTSSPSVPVPRKP